MEQAPLTRAWIKAAIIALAVLIVAIPVIRFAPLPPIVDRSAAFLFAALLPPVIGLGLYSLLRLHRNSVTLALALVSLLMFTFAHVLHTIIERMIGSVPAEAQAMLAGADQSPVNATLAALIVVLHMAKGIFAPLAMFFFALNMLRHPRFGILVGGAGMLIGVVRFAKNVFYFPEHGPLWPALMGASWLWMLIVLFLMATSFRWVDSQSQSDERAGS